jgi:Na+-driven multidrug efflux pump
MEVLKKAIIIATLIMSAGFLLIELLPHAVASVFTTDHDLTDRAVMGLRLVFMFYPLVGFQMVTSTFFQSIGKPGKAIFLSVTRQVLFLIPFLLILPRLWGTNGVWLSMPVADLLSVIISLTMLVNQIKELKKSNL